MQQLRHLTHWLITRSPQIFPEIHIAWSSSASGDSTIFKLLFFQPTDKRIWRFHCQTGKLQSKTVEHLWNFLSTYKCRNGQRYHSNKTDIPNCSSQRWILWVCFRMNNSRLFHEEFKVQNSCKWKHSYSYVAMKENIGITPSFKWVTKSQNPLYRFSLPSVSICENSSTSLRVLNTFFKSSDHHYQAV